VIRIALETQKAEHRRQRRKADAALSQAARVQPRLVELEPGRQEIRDALVEARHEQASDGGVCHKVGSGITLSAAILAGGQARRLDGQDKSALTIGAHSILDRQLTLLRTLTTHIVIVASDHARFAAAGVPVMADRIKGAGALGGVYTALVDAPSERVLVIACDMPFLTRPFLSSLIEQSAGTDAVVPRDARGLHPLCAVYSSRIAPHLKACIDHGRLRVSDALDGLSVLEIGPERLARFDPDGRLLLNVNTPADYERACSAATTETAGR